MSEVMERTLERSDDLELRIECATIEISVHIRASSSSCFLETLWIGKCIRAMGKPMTCVYSGYSHCSLVVGDSYYCGFFDRFNRVVDSHLGQAAAFPLQMPGAKSG